MSEEKLIHTQITPPEPETARPLLKDTFRGVTDHQGGDLPQVQPQADPHRREYE